MVGLEDFFKGYDKARVENAMRRAKLLAENPKVQEAISRVDKKEITSMLRNLSEADKNRLMKSFLEIICQNLFMVIPALYLFIVFYHG